MSVKKIVTIILLAASFIVLAVFIAQNNQAVTIRFMSWSYNSQSGLIVLFSFLAGVFVSILIWLFSLVFKKRPRKEKEEPVQEETGETEVPGQVTEEYKNEEEI